MGLARGATARVSVLVFATALAGLYGVSSLYHRLDWTPPVRRRIRGADHAMIYLLIAASYTPFGVLALSGTFRWFLLGLVWAGAAGGIVLKLGWVDRLRRLSGALYIVLGWLAVLGAPQFVRSLSGPVLALIVAGGLLYTVGAVVLFRRRPDPRPHVFGYHEVWHAFTVGAGVCHYVAALLLVRT